MLGLSHQEATDSPYIASMGVYCFKTEALLNLLTRQYPSSNDFGSEVIPAAIRDHDVQVRFYKTHVLSFFYPLNTTNDLTVSYCFWLGIHIQRLLGGYWNYKDIL